MATTSKDGSRRETYLNQRWEVVMRCNYIETFCKRKGLDWRASRVPAAAVIPAPIVSMVNAAVKKFVVLDLFIYFEMFLFVI